MTYMILLVPPEKAMGTEKNNPHIKFSLLMRKQYYMEHYYTLSIQIMHIL